MYGYTYNLGWLAAGRRRRWEEGEGRTEAAVVSFRLWDEVLDSRTRRQQLTADEIRDTQLEALVPQFGRPRWPVTDEFVDNWELVMTTSWALAEARRLRRHEADDIAASVAMRFHRAGEERPVPPAIHDWVKKAVLNECRDRWRSQQRRPETLREGDKLAILGDQRVQSEGFRGRSSTELRDVLARVAKTEVDLVILEAIAAGWSAAEIAHDLDLSRMTVSRKLKRIRVRAPWLADQLGHVRQSSVPRAS